MTNSNKNTEKNTTLICNLGRAKSLDRLYRVDVKRKRELRILSICFMHNFALTIFRGIFRK